MSTVTRGHDPSRRYEAPRRSHATCPLEFRRTVKSIRDTRIAERKAAWERTRAWAWGIALTVAAVVTITEYNL